MPLPDRYLPDSSTDQTAGIQTNLGFESLTVNDSVSKPVWVEPFRLFTATESALLQDLDEDPAIPPKNRFLHYLIGEDRVTLISEHLYPMELAPFGALFNGLAELMTLDPGGHFLGLERAFGLKGFAIKLFQLSTGGATDISTFNSLKGDVTGIAPIRKRLLLDLETLDISLDNLEGMTLGPQLPGGDRSLILVSDDNFSPDQVTQLLLFRLKGL
ncbi:MAG: esterase-like activity of phytase family protein [Leptolyngbyaceae cyanobacterium MO_188.B28]|nr:esterase-like activity of phytase family protein [Leptolyngbyaceae cyanobacterium MO_188.B28]